MNKKTLTFATISVIFLLAICFWLNWNYDRVEIISKSHSFSDIDGSIKKYDLPAYANYYRLSRFICELCYTLATAIIVFLVVERALFSFDKKQEKKDRDDNLNKIKELQDEINKNVFEGVLKNLIPKTLFEILASDVFYRDIIRQNAIWEYTISENESGGYTLEQNISFEFLNIGNLKRTIPLTTVVTHNRINESSFEFYRVEKHDGTPIVEQGKDELAANTTKNENELTRNVLIEIEGKQIIKVIHKVVVKYASKNICDCHWSKYSIIGLNIRINKPATCKFSLFPTFSESLKIEREDPYVIIYKPVKGLLVGQSVNFLMEELPEVVVNTINTVQVIRQEGNDIKEETRFMISQNNDNSEPKSEVDLAK